MPQVYLGLGSNQKREYFITAALDALAEAFGNLEVSPVYECESVGFKGNPFFNLVVQLETTLSVGELSRCLKIIENNHGRDRNASKYSPRTLDVDILLYGDYVGVFDGVHLPRGEITENAFVLRPLADLAPDALHPSLQQSYAELWRDYTVPQKLWPISFKWRGKVLGTLTL